MDRLAAMQVYITVIDTGSFSGAARQMRIGQPAVSKIIAQLEDRLGVTLLSRSSRKLSATDAGRLFYERAKHAIGEVDEAELAAKGAGAGLVGTLRVSAPITFTRLRLVPSLGRFLAQHPNLDLELILDDRNIDLIGEGIDIALRMGPSTDSSLVGRKLIDIPQRVVGAPDYFVRVGVPKTPRDLEDHQAVIYEPQGGGPLWTFVKDGTEENVLLRGHLRTTAAEAVREAVLAGLGLAVASEAMFDPELKSGAIREVLADWRLPTIDLWAVFPSGRRVSAKARSFLAFVEKEVVASR